METIVKSWLEVLKEKSNEYKRLTDEINKYDYFISEVIDGHDGMYRILKRYTNSVNYSFEHRHSYDFSEDFLNGFRKLYDKAIDEVSNLANKQAKLRSELFDWSTQNVE